MQKTFVFHLLVDFCIVDDHIVAFFFSFRKILICFLIFFSSLSFCSLNLIVNKEIICKGDRKTLAVKKYFNEIKQHLNDIINNLKKCNT